MGLNDFWEERLRQDGVDFIRFVDISSLPYEIAAEYPRALLFGKILSKGYISALSNGEKPQRQEFGPTERKMDKLAEKVAEEMNAAGFHSAAKLKYAAMPHKTVALRAGIGFIGKSNLLVSEEYGSALVLGKVLTDAPFKTVSYKPPEPRCGDCNICRDVCPSGALKGTTWTVAAGRNEMLTRKLCSCCMLCMVRCPYTQRYAQ